MVNEDEYSQSQSQRSVNQQVNNIEGFNEANEDNTAEDPPPMYNEDAAVEENETIDNLGQRMRFIHEYFFIFAEIVFLVN